MAAQVAIPRTQTAIIAADADGTLKIDSNVPVIELEPDAVLVKTAALALNPVDTKMFKGFAAEGAILGFDFAGTVVAVGSNITKDVKIGDRVLGSADSMDVKRPSGGAFCEYASTPASLTLKIPDDMSFTDAACMSTSLASAGMALWFSMKIPSTMDSPATGDKRPYVLVYGGSTSTGTMAIQLLKNAGLRPIATCSPHHNEFVLSYGAETVFDYHSPTCAKDIRAYTGNALAYAIDCITLASSMKICYEAVGRAGGRYCALDPFPETQATRRVVKPDWILGSTVKGRGSMWPAPYGREPDSDARSFCEDLYAAAQTRLDAGQLKNHPAQAMQGGFEGILEGIEMIRRKEVNGFKLVYEIKN
ncbi:Alcohol dehydrogenase superfamily, zinc-type [Beauveria brongniartii RCEF 3172]|uniref:Alcohol dehydrogenase superfamily, zinc-type n=1 Tax=Beauveria brongniartii RCEF 3172 TaxID=1081107 RepID=A0A167C5Y8_9HYPO|nr:Alcohol dehydrogenase superfamily, zinc-type [Beauveria brongniartii RCEF 3172]